MEPTQIILLSAGLLFAVTGALVSLNATDGVPRSSYLFSILGVVAIFAAALTS